MHRQIVVIGILVLLLFSSFAVGLGSGNVKGYAMKINERGVKGYTSHSIIRINNDTDFANQASQEGWQGDGSQSNPYVISSYDIDAHGAGDAIYIGNTTVYFVIENCYLHNASLHTLPYFEGVGVTLYNVQNGNLSKNILYNNHDNIFLEYSKSNLLMENDMNLSESIGIYLINSNTNNIFENNITGSGWDGVWLKNSTDNLINKNIIKNNDKVGLGLGLSNNNTLKNNNIAKNGDGIYLYDDSTNNIMSGNNITNNGNGIVLYSPTSNNTISGNNITNNQDGIYLKSSTNNTISGNNITNNQDGGIGLDSSSNNNTIYSNLISNNENYGISIWSGSYDLIYNNSFYYNHGSGDAYNSSHVQVRDEGSNNSWNTTTGIGNYWHDWANNNDTNDNNNDGIVDWPYKIDGTIGVRDKYPLKNATYPMPPLAPTAPRNLHAVAGDGYVNITWEKPLGNGSSPITQYKIYRDGALVGIVSSNQLYYNDTSVQNGQAYTYYVTANNSVGESKKSNEVQATPQGAVPEFSTGIWLFIVILIALLGAIRFRKSS